METKSGFGLSKTINLFPRKKLFITSKFNINTKEVNIEEELEQTLKFLNIKYLDLYLMHWPHPANFITAWKHMEKIYKEGKVKAIGVCNFEKRHFEELFKYAEIKPMINQIEVHPLNTAKETISYCKENNIQIEAYCPLGMMNKEIVENEELKRFG